MAAVDTGVNEIIPSTHKLGVRTLNPNEILSVNGNLALKENPRPSSTSNFGKLYVNGSTSNLMFLDDAGIQYDITSSSAVPGGANTQFQFNDSGVFAGNGSLTFTKASRTIAVAANATLDINSTNLTIADTDIAFDGGSTTFSPTGALTLLPQNGSNLNVTLLGTSDMLIDSTKITLNNNGNLGIGVLPNINNFVSVNGDLALREITPTTAPGGYGKIYIDSSNNELCYDADDQSAVCLTNNGQVAGSGGGGGGGASPGGSNGSVQLRQNSTTFGADATNLHWDDSNNRLGLKTNSPNATLDINGNIAVKSKEEIISAGTGITSAMLDSTVLELRGACTGGVVDITANPQIAAGQPGQILTLVGIYDAEAVKFDDNLSNLHLAGGSSITLGGNDMLVLIYGPHGWTEIARADNIENMGACFN
ncbi:MAG: hypothetical protein LW817_05570 [Candidatus Caenarcaniphilales bacterium]|nr:hypothetical protein [Candidatus Caenarcaniphilales bacterium]